MVEIKAIIQPFMLEKVLHALEAPEGMPGVTISEVRGWGKARGAGAEEPVQEAGHVFGRKMKLEIVVADDQAPQVVETITREARTGRPGDGKIFTYEVEEVVKIRTGERGEAAI